MNRFFSKTSYWLIIGLIVCLTSCKVDKGKPLIGKAILSHTIGGLCAGIAAHWMYVLLTLF